MYEREVQERIGAVLHHLSAIEPKAARSDESRATRHLLTDFRRLARDLERAFETLRECSARQEASQREADIAAGRGRLLLALTSLPYVLVHRRGIILDANDAAAAALNVPVRQLKGRSFDVFVADGGEAFAAQLARVGEETSVARWSVLVRPRDRHSRPFTVAASPAAADNVALVLSAVADTKPRETMPPETLPISA
jgi:PAS domain-containing protein